MQDEPQRIHDRQTHPMPHPVNPTPMPSLREIFYAHEGRLVHKWDHYFEIYDRFFARYRGRELNLLEIGVSQGGSIQLWRAYFGPGLHIYSVDINEECRAFEADTDGMYIGSQEDPAFLRKLRDELPPMDIIIDDGGHTMRQQILTFEYLFPLLKQDGVFLVEDTHTSYWSAFGGGLGRKTSFIEYAKRLIDALHSDHMDKGRGPAEDDRTRDITSIAFYDSIVVFEKRRRPPTFHLQRGTASIRGYVMKTGWWQRMKSRILGNPEATFARNFKR